MIRRHLADEAATRAAGEALAAALEPGTVIHLRGDLGTGKTTLVAALLSALGVEGPVRSPTYTLVEPYEAGDKRLLHLDLYRLADPEELEWLGIRDLADGEAVLLVEWPERGEGVLPAADLEMRLAHAAAGRDLVAEARTPRGRRLLAAIARHF